MSTAAITVGHPADSAQVIGRTFRSSFVSDARPPIIFVLDEDVSVRESLEQLVLREGWRYETLASAQELLARLPGVVPNCLVIDTSVPGINALDLQKRVAGECSGTSVIFIAAQIDVPTTVKVMKAGAVGIFIKPLSNHALLASIQEALERSRVAIAREAEARALRDRYALLTTRERQVMALVVSGLLNKQIGGQLGISEITVKAHRGQVMQKMKADSLAGLVRMAGRPGLASVAESEI
jgi:FixJ family two-component response regulator